MAYLYVLNSQSPKLTILKCRRGTLFRNQGKRARDFHVGLGRTRAMARYFGQGDCACTILGFLGMQTHSGRVGISILTFQIGPLRWQVLRETSDGTSQLWLGSQWWKDPVNLKWGPGYEVNNAFIVFLAVGIPETDGGLLGMSSERRKMWV
jgi:hypothetical protein